MKQTRIAGLVLLASAALTWTLSRDRSHPPPLEAGRAPADATCQGDADCPPAEMPVAPCADPRECEATAARPPRGWARVVGAAGTEATGSRCKLDADCPAAHHCAL